MDNYISGGNEQTPFEFHRPAWQARANCHPAIIDPVWQPFGKHPVDLFYPDARPTPARLEAIEQVCGPCPVRSECHAHALESEEHGTWGGEGQQAIRLERRATGVRLHLPEVDPKNGRILGTWIPPAHGTQARYVQHRRDGEDPCPLCIQGHAMAGQEGKQAARARRRATETPAQRTVRLQEERQRWHDAAVRRRKGTSG
jgi:hypothetical protein